MGWLKHRFAKSVQNGVLGLAILFGTPTAGGLATYYGMTDGVPDDVTGANRVEMMASFNASILKLEDTNKLYDESTKTYRQAFLNGNSENAPALYKKTNAIEDIIRKQSGIISRELHLAPSLSEQDYLDLGTRFNASTPLDIYKVDLDNAAYLHDAQKRYLGNGILSEGLRDSRAEEIQKTMVYRASDDELSFPNYIGIVLSVFFSFWISGTMTESLGKSGTLNKWSKKSELTRIKNKKKSINN